MADNVVPLNPLAGKMTKGTPVTQDWVARQFALEYKGQLAFCHDAGRWFAYDGSAWRPQKTPIAFDLARELSRRMSDEASNKTTMQGANFWKGVEAAAAADKTFARTAPDWDKNTWLLGTPEGTIDLRTGDFRPSRPDDMITKCTAVAPDEIEDCPLWQKFLLEATGGDEELILFLQRWCGYCLTGDTSEQTLTFFYGPGGAGKGTFKGVFSGVMGEYALTASMKSFAASKTDNHPTDLAGLQGSRLVAVSETKEGSAWDEERIKQITGQDKLRVRFMNKDFFEYLPTYKLTILGNNQPVISNLDVAMRRRFLIVPFNVIPKIVDKHLDDKLREEWPSILRWMIQGCLDWQKSGLPRPASVIAATEEYFEDQDMIGQWLDEVCTVEIGNPYRNENISTLFASWVKYAKAAGEEAGTNKSFTAKMLRRGFSRRRSAYAKGLEGIELRVRGDARED